jgi:hypothetical protein
VTFTGWGAEAFELLALASGPDTPSAMQARRDRHERLVREPMSSLCDALAEQFGPAYVWHLHSAPHLWRSQVAEVEVADRVVLGLRLRLSAARRWRSTQHATPPSVDQTCRRSRLTRNG